MINAIVNGLFSVLSGIMNVLFAPINLLFSAVPGLNLLPGVVTWISSMFSGVVDFGLKTLGVSQELWNIQITVVVFAVTTGLAVKGIKTILRLVRGY